MLTILSPAKKLSNECFARTQNYTTPTFLNESQALVDILRSKKPIDLQNLMGISDKLSVLNWERFQNWKLPVEESSAKEAIYHFQGDTYSGLNTEDLSSGEITFAQKNTRILSGLYGVLKPLDLILPYRLEMGTKLKNDKGDSLYQFWGDTLSKFITNELKSHSAKVLINCASVEYFKSLNNNSLKADVVTPHFKELKNGNYKIISFFAKKARGMMARFIIKNKIQEPSKILQFDYAGYQYNDQLSSPLNPVFTRAQS